MFLLFTFFLGMYMYATDHIMRQYWKQVESQEDSVLEQMESRPCYDLLVEQNGALMLYNQKAALNTSTNPLVFAKGMPEYLAYVDTQRAEGNTTCPVLSVTQNAESIPMVDYGRYLFSHFPGASKTKPVPRAHGFNQTMLPDIDPAGLYQGVVYTEIDAKKNSNAV
jgi:hypothetical protein